MVWTNQIKRLLILMLEERRSYGAATLTGAWQALKKALPANVRPFRFLDDFCETFLGDLSAKTHEERRQAQLDFLRQFPDFPE